MNTGREREGESPGYQAGGQMQGHRGKVLEFPEQLVAGAARGENKGERGEV